MSPSEIWDQIDRVSRISCCYVSRGGKCEGYHPQGTRVVYGYEALSRAAQGALFSARNSALDEAISEISKLAVEGVSLKSTVLEILSGLKVPTV